MIACHMAANLLSNARHALKRLPIRKCQAWSDSTVALYRILSSKEYKPVVNKRVRKIKGKENIDWNYVNTKENPADLGSRGCHGDDLNPNWRNGPKWLPKPEDWPEKIEISSSEESEKEALSTKKMIKEVMATATEVKSKTEDIKQNVLESFHYMKVVRILAGIADLRKFDEMK